MTEARRRDESVRCLLGATGRSDSPYGELDGHVKIEFWLSSGDLYGWENYSWPSFHFIIFSRKSSFDNTFSDLYKALNMVF